MQILYYHINAFTNKKFSGNPAAVIVLDDWLSDDKLQLIARENYLPATAFLVRQNDGYQTRWFAPEYEIDLCGHGSLASAYVIFNILEPNFTVVNLDHPSGKFRVIKLDNYFMLDFPAREIELFESDLLKEGLGINPQVIYQYKSERCLVVINSEEQLRKLSPDMTILRNLPHRGVVVTSTSEKYDFVSRTFYPKKSASEDAVTGSSHCLLIPYWAKKLNKSKLHAYQASFRGGEILCELKTNRVGISGQAIMYAQGTIIL